MLLAGNTFFVDANGAISYGLSGTSKINEGQPSKYSTDNYFVHNHAL